jgi:predicted Zn-dependent protease with MMP-like domain
VEQGSQGEEDVTQDDELQALYAEADEALSTGDYEHVEELVGRRTRGRSPDPRACGLLGLAHFYAGEYAEARPLLEVAVRENPEDVEARCGLGASAFFNLDLAPAEKHLRQVVKEDPDWAAGHYWLARVLDWRSTTDPRRAEEAGRHFRRAAEIEPEDFPAPLSLSEVEFVAVLQQAVRSLPSRVARVLEEVTIAIDSYPDESFLEGPGGDLGPDLLGLYTGTSLPERHHLDSGRLPDVIHLFKRNLEVASADREELMREIRDTLLHEVGHYLGLEEEGLEELGL